MREYKLKLRDIDAPPIVVLYYSVETYFAISEEQAERNHVGRCIHPDLPNHHKVYSAMHHLGESFYEEKERYEGLTVWKIQKKNWKDIIKILGLEKTDYPYRQALNMIEGEYFWIFAYDD